MEKFEGFEIDTSRMEEYRKHVPFEVRLAAKRRMQGFPELDEGLDEEDGEPAYFEVRNERRGKKQKEELWLL